MNHHQRNHSFKSLLLLLLLLLRGLVRGVGTVEPGDPASPVRLLPGSFLLFGRLGGFTDQTQGTQFVLGHHGPGVVVHARAGTGRTGGRAGGGSLVEVAGDAVGAAQPALLWLTGQ